MRVIRMHAGSRARLVRTSSTCIRLHAQATTCSPARRQKQGSDWPIYNFNINFYTWRNVLLCCAPPAVSIRLSANDMSNYILRNFTCVQIEKRQQIFKAKQRHSSYITAAGATSATKPRSRPAPHHQRLVLILIYVILLVPTLSLLAATQSSNVLQRRTLTLVETGRRRRICGGGGGWNLAI